MLGAVDPEELFETVEAELGCEVVDWMEIVEIVDAAENS